MRRSILALLVTVGLAPASAAWAARAAPAVELVAPRPHETLVAGGRATLEWRLAGAAAPDFSEWEAFLSLDGGASWPVRLTPHLDAGLRRVTVSLPPVVTAHARLLLRFGDEREEVSVPVAHELVLAPARGRLELPETRPAAAPGEAARPGAPGVTTWVEGRRDGRESIRYEVREPGLASGAAALLAAEVARPLGEDDGRPQLPAIPAPRSAATVAAPPVPTPARPPIAPRATSLRLALLSRRNE